MDLIWTVLVILLLRYPHSLKSWETRQCRRSQPRREKPLRRRKHFHLHVALCELFNFLPQSISHPFKQCVTSWQNQIAKQFASKFWLTSLDRVDTVLLNTIQFEVSKSRFKNCFRTFEPFSTKLNFASIRHNVLFVVLTAFICIFHGLVKILDNITHFFFNVP